MGTIDLVEVLFHRYKKNLSDCPECLDDEAGRLCGDCAAKHDCDPEMSLPLVNSPRTGFCGYEGAGKE